MKKIHFLGIGGSGTSAVAKIAEAQGFEITGCDINPFNEFTTGFKKTQLFEGHDPKHLENIDILAVTPAIYSLDPKNPELMEAKKKGIEILTWQQFMGKYLEEGKKVIAVCGTHGKSTTTAMIAKILEDANLDPTAELGAIIPGWKTNYRIGKGDYFVTEADEYNDNFLATKPDIAVVLTIEMDHPEYFANFDSYKRSFTKFLEGTKDKIIANLKDPGVASVLKNYRGKAEIVDFSEKPINFELKIPGEYNRINASAANAAGSALQIKPEVLKQSLENFRGIGRRFELLGEYKGSKIYSDFGHHPTELKVTLETARLEFPDTPITVIFQPHMFSRTKALFADFVKVLQNGPVDRIYIMDIYKSREKDLGIVNSKQLVEAINKDNTFYLPQNELKEKMDEEAKKKGVLFFVGAGDIHDLAKKMVKD